MTTTLLTLAAAAGAGNTTSASQPQQLTAAPAPAGGPHDDNTDGPDDRLGGAPNAAPAKDDTSTQTHTFTPNDDNHAQRTAFVALQPRSSLARRTHNNARTVSIFSSSTKSCKVGRLDAQRRDVKLSLDSQLVSSAHCEFILNENNDVMLVDVSRNGTFVNGYRITKHEPKLLTLGDVISFGATTIGPDDEVFSYVLAREEPPPSDVVALNATPRNNQAAAAATSPKAASPAKHIDDMRKMSALNEKMRTQVMDLREKLGTAEELVVDLSNKLETAQEQNSLLQAKLVRQHASEDALAKMQQEMTKMRRQLEREQSKRLQAQEQVVISDTVIAATARMRDDVAAALETAKETLEEMGAVAEGAAAAGGEGGSGSEEEEEEGAAEEGGTQVQDVDVVEEGAGGGFGGGEGGTQVMEEQEKVVEEPAEEEGEGEEARLPLCPETQTPAQEMDVEEPKAAEEGECASAHSPPPDAKRQRPGEKEEEEEDDDDDDDDSSPPMSAARRRRLSAGGGIRVRWTQEASG